MRAAFGFIGILIVLGIGYYIYSAQLRNGPDSESLPQQTNLIAVRQDLLSFGQAERLYLAANGRYATIEQLKDSRVVSNLPDGTHWGYEYRAEVDGAQHFRITANPIQSSGSALPTLSVDETLQISH